MNPNPPRAGPSHRRALSDTTFRFCSSPSDVDNENENEEDFLLDLVTPPGPHNNNNNNNPIMSVDSPESSGENRSSSHVRSLSMEAHFFDGLSFEDTKPHVGGGGGGGGGGGQQHNYHHRRTNSMDGCSSSSAMFTTGNANGNGNGNGEIGILDGVKKAMPPEKLAELALIDPKRAKRILANRQSAARSKERKIRYISELERKVQTLQTEATTLSAQVTLLLRDTTGLTAENDELKLRLQALEQQAQLRDALNEALRQEVQQLRIATGQVPPGNEDSSALAGPFLQFATTGQFGSCPQQSAPQPPFQMRSQQPANQTAVPNQLKSNFLGFNQHRI